MKQTKTISKVQLRKRNYYNLASPYQKKNLASALSCCAISCFFWIFHIQLVPPCFANLYVL